MEADRSENADLLPATSADLTPEAHRGDAEAVGVAVERLLANVAVRAAATRTRADFADMSHPCEGVAVIEKLVALAR